MQPVAPCGLRDVSRSPLNHGRDEAISGSLSTHQHCRCGRWRKKTSERQKCNLEAALRGVSNRLLVREWCLCVALPKTSSVYGHMPLWAADVDLNLWGGRWALIGWWDTSGKKCGCSKWTRLLLFYYFRHHDQGVLCGKVNTAHQTRTLIRFIVASHAHQGV